jgi:hypothetical protein
MVSRALLALLASVSLASAFSLNRTLTNNGEDMSYLDGSIRAGVVSSACETAYAQEIPCDDSLLSVFDQNSDSSSNEADKFSNSTLNALCTDTCLKGLQKWRDDVRRECSPNDFKEGSEKETSTGLTIIAQIMDVNKKMVEYLYWPTCTRDLYVLFIPFSVFFYLI